MENDIDWALEHWWIYALLLLLSFAILLLATHLERRRSQNKALPFWKFVWVYWTCSHENNELIDGDKIFHCKDCGTKLKI